MDGGTFLFLLAIFGGYMLPTIVALLRHARQRNAICVLNMLLGWLFIPWVIALVWASMNDRTDNPLAKTDDGKYYGGYSV